jgi:hypothetical protein
MSPACGTKSGYQKHTRAGEQPCAQCTEANRDYMREYRKHNNRGRRARTEHILLDLIAELQDASTGYDPDCQNGCGDVPGAGCPTHYEQAVERAADRAEQRLREVTGE